MTTRIALLLAAVATAACAPADACAELCEVGRTHFEACLDATGATWGAEVGYTDAADFDNACDTFVWEQRTLGEAESCDARLAGIRATEADPCARNYQTTEVE